MASFWDNLRLRFKQGNAVTKLLFLNIGVFLLLRLLLVFVGLFKIQGEDILTFVQLPSDVLSLMSVPWTIVTYMFVHLDLMHILFNMLWLYFFGGLFLRWLNAVQFWVLYLAGGLFGAIFFLASYQFLPAFQGIEASLIGASASILALGIAVAIYRPDEPVPLFIFGVIRLKWLAIIMVVMDLLSLNGSNAGGSVAHIGGSVAGLFFGLGLRNNKNMTRWLNPILNGLANMFKPKPKMRVTYQHPKSEKATTNPDPDQEYRDRKKADADRLDSILDKIKKSGYDTLSSEDKRFLFESSRHEK